MKTGQQKISDFYNSKRVLITGDRGYVGSALYKKMKSLGCEVISFEGDVSSRLDWFTDPNLNESVDLIFHLAAIEYNSGTPYEDLNVNAVSTLHMLDCCESKNFTPKIIFASSSNIFGRAETLPVTEKQKDSPASFWSAHKLLAENYLQIYNSITGIESVSLRLSNVYGPSTSIDLMRRMALNKMIEMAIKNNKLNLYNNAECVRDWVYIDDVVNAFLMAGMLNEERALSFLIGSEDGDTIENATEVISERVKFYYNKNVEISFDHDTELSSMAMRNYKPDCTLFKQVTGWQPIGLREGVDLTVRYFYDL